MTRQRSVVVSPALVWRASFPWETEHQKNLRKTTCQDPETSPQHFLPLCHHQDCIYCIFTATTLKIPSAIPHVAAWQMWPGCKVVDGRGWSRMVASGARRSSSAQHLQSISQWKHHVSVGSVCVFDVMEEEKESVANADRQSKTDRSVSFEDLFTEESIFPCNNSPTERKP